MIVEFILMVLTVISSLFLHEGAHIFILQRLIGRRVLIGVSWRGLVVGTKKDYVGLVPKQYFFIVAGGVIAGLIPIILLGLLSPVLKVCAILLFVFYVIMSLHDIKQIIKLFKKEVIVL